MTTGTTTKIDYMIMPKTHEITGDILISTKDGIPLMSTSRIIPTNAKVYVIFHTGTNTSSLESHLLVADYDSSRHMNSKPRPITCDRDRMSRLLKLGKVEVILVTVGKALPRKTVLLIKRTERYMNQFKDSTLDSNTIHKIVTYMNKDNKADDYMYMDQLKTFIYIYYPDLHFSRKELEEIYTDESFEKILIKWVNSWFAGEESYDHLNDRSDVKISIDCYKIMPRSGVRDPEPEECNEFIRKYLSLKVKQIEMT